MFEIHPAVDATVINAKKMERQRADKRRAVKKLMAQEYKTRVIKRAQETMYPVLWRVGIATTAIILLSILRAFDLIAPDLVDFGVSMATGWLAICLGAGLQYILCERGYMK